MRYRLLLLVLLLSGFLSGVDGQWLSGYGYRKSITIPAGQVIGGTQTNFPVLVSVTDNDLKTIANGGFVENNNGWDIVFSVDNVNPLDHQVESYNPVTGELIAWVRLPSLPAGGFSFNTYFGNSSISSDPSTTSTWNANYMGVWHLHDDFQDGTSNNINGSNNGTTDIAGKIGDGQDFDGTGQYIEISQAAIPDATFTVSMWFQYSTYAGTLFDASNNADPPNGKFFFAGSDNVNTYWGFEDVNDADVQISIANSPGTTWHYLTLIGGLNNNIHELYLDGSLIGSDNTVRAGKPNINNIRLGYSYGHTLNTFGNYDGIIDETRISSIRRSLGWIRTEYNNQNAPGSFMSFGSREDGYPQIFNVSGSGLIGSLIQ